MTLVLLGLSILSPLVSALENKTKSSVAVTTDSEKKLRRHLTAFSKRTKMNSSKKERQTNQQRVKDLSLLLKNVQATLTQPFSKSVTVQRRSGNKFVSFESYDVDYKVGASKEENSGFTIKSGKSSTRFDSSVGSLIGSFLANPQWFDSFANIYEIKAGKKDSAMVKGTRKFLIVPKKPLLNVKLAYAYVDKTNNVTRIDVLNTQRGYLAYDFSKSLKSSSVKSSNKLIEPVKAESSQKIQP